MSHVRQALAIACYQQYCHDAAMTKTIGVQGTSLDPIQSNPIKPADGTVWYHEIIGVGCWQINTLR